ncbi:transcriptional regulator, AsnC family [Albimonas donghaensis]|uniref:Transcriptional regulator, AsnC family n=1 Tax=Albimonas donghaensis TaxID=356660 RepID=A0A1H3EA56_9RHOB|nr:Lrp/AsnC ligand binding domain-containing protein [Albimonas donghaensis]MAS43656.1 AsnC family transcriptional regulator [Paracoccaceae bacterium]MBR27956.1 AsnC family transcriptional regulator [Paracoccaceae bacterium]SDX75545.1 transcriptional regulator, AsnC family [Albimonas donghaensis]|tara:strand:- start:1256 stop:1492 length:237 start_codon:yes stop_codon:yes gene_type:complete
MQCFFVQIKTRLGRAYDVADQLARREVASEIYSTSGEWDLLAKFYVADDVDIGHFINEEVHGLDGLERTFTTLTFKAF